MGHTIDILLLGLIEGLTEFLPVSSTGHLLLAEHFLPPQSDLFNTGIQSGAVCAVLVLFGGRVRELIATRNTPATRTYLLQLTVAFGLTAVGGLALKRAHFKLPETMAPVAWATLVGGVLFVALELWLKSRRTKPAEPGISWPVAVGMGAGQLLAAVFPGASRSGSTILLGLLLGAQRPQAAEFSFLLGIPTLLAAGGVQALTALRAPGPMEPVGDLLLASVVAAGVAFAVVRWLLGYVQHHTFMVFGVYRILLGGTMLLWG